MHIHILGISGTFMCGLALLAREAGFKVTGSDSHCYPPVSDLLQAKGIQWTEGYEDATAALAADMVVVGNAIRRGFPVMEEVLRASKPYTSGPAWLAEHILPKYNVIGVQGTHGKTTATTMVAWILDQAGQDPGFLIGGVAPSFNTSAHLGTGSWFVIEADEYDSAYFDKRPKFMHYKPQIAILNNLEFDHADIYNNLGEIQKQFHYLLRTIPPQGMIIKPKHDTALNEVCAEGVYSNMEELSITDDADWSAKLDDEYGSSFAIVYKGKQVAHIKWPLIGLFNVENALAAIAATANAGVDPQIAAKALERFTPVKRRLEVRSNNHGITVYDDFAHHPTAISRTIDALVKSKRHKRIFAVMEFASYTMRSGVHKDKIPQSLNQVNGAFILNPQGFELINNEEAWTFPHKICNNNDEIVAEVVKAVQDGDAVLVMSNRGFDGIHQQLMHAIDARFN